MNYLLDTNAVIALIKGKPELVRKRFKRALAKESSIFTSSIVLFELWYGVHKSQRRKENSERVRSFLSGPINIAHFENEDALVAGELRAQLESAGMPIGPYDLLIAAQAVSAKLVLVTANTSEFARVPGLKWQDWSIV